VDVFTAIASARAVRRFDPRPLSADQLDRILEAGRLSPSSNNEQRWAFIVCSDRDHLEQLSKIGVWAGHLADAAAAIAIVVPESDVDGDPESIAFDTGQCARSMMLAAWELGIGSCHASVYDPQLTRQLLGYPDGMRCDLVISFGNVADPASLTRPIPSSSRRPMAELLHQERW
jgi:nitroreductase